ncbi:MAG: hypothetical protein RI958_297, partial [Actinomycetota bacterium]
MKFDAIGSGGPAGARSGIRVTIWLNIDWISI